MSPVMKDVIGMLSAILSTHDESEIVDSVLKALKVIISTATNSEEQLIVDAIPIILKKTRSRTLMENAFTSLSAIMYVQLRHDISSS